MTRAEINDYLNQSHDDFWFLHCDAWHYNTTYRCLNCGVQEPNMLNIAAGLMLNKNKVIVYSIAGFVLEKCVEQMRLVIPDGDLIILNAGCHHEYPLELGKGHQIEPKYLFEYYKEQNFNISNDFKSAFKSHGKYIVLLGKE